MAGGIVWRETPAGPRLALIHRPSHGDWSLPKGRLDPGETWQDAARREIAEETGWIVRLGCFAGAKLLLARPDPKLVLYWHARAVREARIASPGEVDEVAWLSRREALHRLDRASDRRLLLRALGGSTAEPWRASRGGAGAADLATGELRSLVVVDSRAAEEAVPSILRRIARAVATGAARADARRAGSRPGS